MERLEKEMERLTQQIAMYEVQASAQAEETRAAKEALSEVTTCQPETASIHQLIGASVTKLVLTVH